MTLKIGTIHAIVNCQSRIRDLLTIAFLRPRCSAAAAVTHRAEPPKTALRLGIVSEDCFKVFAPILEFDYPG
jgi:hypothetical protein